MTLNSTNRSRFMMITVIGNEAMTHCDDIYDYVIGLKACNFAELWFHNKGRDGAGDHYHLICQFTNPTKLNIKHLHTAHVDTGRFGSIQQMKD